MSINNVILKDNYTSLLSTNSIPFEVSLDGTEKLVYKTNSPRQSLSISLKNSTTHINTKDGHIYLTNKRLVFITASQGDVNTFLIDLSLSPSLQFSHELKSPWFGPNYWQFMFYSTQNPPIASDGFPKNQYFEGKVQFNDGGLFQFIEVLNQVLNDAVNNSHIDDQLPSYTEL